MKEIMIDIFFTVGFTTLVSILTALIFWTYFVVREFSMQNKSIFENIFNREFDKKIKDFSDEDFEKWVMKLRKRVIKNRIENETADDINKSMQEIRDSKSRPLSELLSED